MKILNVFVLLAIPLLWLSTFGLTNSFASGNPDPNQSVIGDFIRNEDGSVRASITPESAAEECARRGSRLPTAREIAKETEKWGLKILEESDYAAGNIPDGYVKSDFYKVPWTFYEFGEIDRFYYSARNYKRPFGDLGDHSTWCWSSDPGRPSAWAFDGMSGRFYLSNRYLNFFYAAARCVVGGAGVK